MCAPPLTIAAGGANGAAVVAANLTEHGYVLPRISRVAGWTPCCSHIAMRKAVAQDVSIRSIRALPIADKATRLRTWQFSDTSNGSSGVSCAARPNTSRHCTGSFKAMRNLDVVKGDTGRATFSGTVGFHCGGNGVSG